jgi:hypothetical protein
MAGKLIYDGSNPKTQSTESVKVLLAYVGRPSDPMPVFVELAGGVRLTRSNKGDAYYTTTSRDCSCPARAYNPGSPCKHMKALQIAMDNASIRPECGAFRPFSELPSEERRAVEA